MTIESSTVKKHRTKTARVLAAAGCAVLLPALASACASTQANASQSQPAQTAPAEGRLLDQSLSDAERIVAARSLTASGRKQDIAELNEAIRSPSVSTARLTLTGIAREPVAPPALLPAIVERSTDQELSRNAAGAIASIRTPEAARALVQILQNSDAATKQAAASALVRLTGAPPSTDPEHWDAWIDDASASAARWQQAIFVSIAARADTLSEETEASARSVAATLLQLYDASTAEARPDVLVRMVSSAAPQTRAASIRLIEREIAQGTAIAPRVGQAAVSLLTASQPQARIDGANLLDTLVPEGAGTALVVALDNEHSPTVAAAMLRASSRYPIPELAPAVLRWLDPASHTTAQGSLAQAAAQAERAGWALAQAEVISPADQRFAAALLREGPITDRTPAGLRLMAAVGDNNDRNRLSKLLQTTDPESSLLRRAAAQALALYPEHMIHVLRAARAEPALFDVAVAAVSRHQATRAGYRTIASLTPPDETSMRAAKLDLASKLVPSQLLKVALSEQDLDLRAAVLARTEELAISQDTLAPLDESALIDALAVLAETRLELGRAESALSAAIAARQRAERNQTQPLQRITKARTLALISLRRFEEAWSINQTLAVWLEALRIAQGQPLAPSLAAFIEDRLGESLTVEQRAILSSAAATQEAPPPEQEADEATPAVPPGT